MRGQANDSEFFNPSAKPGQPPFCQQVVTLKKEHQLGRQGLRPGAYLGLIERTQFRGKQALSLLLLVASAMLALTMLRGAKASGDNTH